MRSRKFWRLTLPPRVLDAALAVAVAILGAIRLPGGSHQYGLFPVAAAEILAAMGLILFFRRRLPAIVLAAVAAAVVILLAMGSSVEGALLAVLVASYSAVVHGTRWLARGLTWTAVVIMSATAITTLLGVEGWPRTHLPLTTILAAAAAVLAGFAIRNQFSLRSAQLGLLAERDELLAERQQEEIQRVRLAERLRIARELHDIVAHHISVVVIRSQGAQRMATTDPAAARDVMAEVEKTGRTALEEMRRLVGVLRSGEPAADGGPDEAAAAPGARGLADAEAEAERPAAPGLADIGPLAERMRTAGLDVTIETIGKPRPVPDDVGLAAFRIVQEALTNVLKHAGPARVQVAVDFTDGLEIRVADDGRGAAAHPNGARVPGAGAGITGMTERAAAAGGHLTAGPRPDGGFRVRATIPLDGP